MNLSLKWAAGLGLSALLIFGNVWQLYRNSQLKSDVIQARNNETFWHMQYLNCKQSPVVIQGIGEYHVDTLKTTDTLKIPAPVHIPIMNYISFDTTAKFGTESNPERIRVAGKFYTDSAYKPLNRLEIWNLGYEHPTTLPPEPEVKSWQLGLYGGGGLVGRQIAGVIGADLNRDNKGAWIQVIGKEKDIGVLTGIRYSFNF